MSLPATAPKKQLLKLPTIEYSKERGWYPFLLIVPTKDLHDSGYRHIAVIGGGYENGEPVAKCILAHPDDLSLPNSVTHDTRLSKDTWNSMRIDAFGDNGVLRLWSHSHEFSTSSPLSSVDVFVRNIEEA